MSKTRLRTDPDRLVEVTIYGLGASQSATTGQYSELASAVVTIEGDLQPISGQLRHALSGLDPQAKYVFFPLTQLGGSVTEEMLLVVGNESGAKYRIAFIRSWGTGMPEELYLVKLSDPGEV